MQSLGSSEQEYFVGLVKELCKLPSESEWVEFKLNKINFEEIGEYVSALANSAALVGKSYSYLVWGVEDSDHSIIGTTFNPAATKIGNEELENWLIRLLKPRIHFRFVKIEVDSKCVVVMEIERAHHQPVQFQGQEFIRIGSYKKKLKDFPEKERALWRIFDLVSFEEGVARERVGDDEVLKLLDFSSYFELFGRSHPAHRNEILEALSADALIRPCEAGGWDITNLGAILFAKRLSEFAALGRKALRIVIYKGDNRIETVKEEVGTNGYAAGFAGLIAFINSTVPTNEVIGQAIRKSVPMYPALAVREIVANAIIHQDFFVKGAGPMVEIFANRIEATNPGIPLVATERFLDTPPKSRNEALASLMRRVGICEERGSGIDKVVFLTEFYQLPAPLFEVTGDSTRAVLFSHQSLTKMNKIDRIRASYLHACLKYVSNDFMTNTTVRERFGIEPQNSATASRIIKEAVDAGVIAPHDPLSAPKLMKYAPWWATRQKPREGT